MLHRYSQGLDEYGNAAVAGGAPEAAETTKSEFKPAKDDEYAAAIKANPQAATLTDPDAMKGNRKFSNGEGVYYSISPEGDMQGLVNNSGKKGAIKAATEHAIAQGGKTLDAWDLYLPKQYEKYGFERTKSIPYDVKEYGEPSEELKAGWKQQGWKDGDPYPAVQHMKLKETPKATPETAKMSDTELLKHGFTKEDIDAGKHLPTVSGAKALPSGDDLIKKYGESSGDPANTVFILKDGRGVRNTGSDHDVMLGGRATDTNPPREKFIADGNIRIRPRMGAGREVSLSIPESGINTKQLAYIEKMAPQLRSGAVLIEVGKPGGEYRILSQGEATPEALGKVLNELAPMKNAKGSPIDEYGNPTVSGGSDKPTTGRVNKFGEVVPDTKAEANAKAMRFVVKAPEGFRAIGDNANHQGTASTFSYENRIGDFESRAEAKAAAEKYASDPNNFHGQAKKPAKEEGSYETKEGPTKTQNAPPENFTHELKASATENLKGIVDRGTIIVTPEGNVHSYDTYEPSSENYTHSSLFNQILSDHEDPELSKYQTEDEDASEYDPTGDYTKFLDAGGIRAFTTGSEEAGIEMHAGAPAGTIAKALRTAEALGRPETTLEITDPQQKFKTVFSKTGTYDQLKNAVHGWADDNGMEVYPGEKENPTVSGGSPAAGTAKAKEALPKLAEEHGTKEEIAGATKTKASTEKFVKNLESLPEVQEYKDIALAGEGARKWYQRSSQAFQAMSEEAPEYFKEEGDKDKFINLLASSSPRQSVAMNMRETLGVWKAYVDAGRPTGEALKNLLRENFTLPNTKVPNAMKALGGEEMWPDLTKNTAFKAPSFARNLRGWLDSATNDGWMSLFAGVDPKDIARPESYHPLSIATRAAAKELGWETAEAQAAIWSFTQALTERGEELPAEVRKHSEDFVDILAHDPQTRELLADLGVSHANLDAKLRAIGEKPEVTGRTTGTTSRSIGKLKERIETARGKGIIPPPKSAQGEFSFREAPAGEHRATAEDEDTSFDPNRFHTTTTDVMEQPGKKKSPLKKM